MLPSAKRPKVVEEERAARLEEQQKERHQRLKLKFSKEDIFKKTMKAWYEQLKESKKKRLSPLKLKRKAVNVCFSLKMEYDKLSPDWIEEMTNEQGLKLYQRKQSKRDGFFDETLISSQPVSTIAVTNSGRQVKGRRLLQMGKGASLSFAPVASPSPAKAPLNIDSDSNMSSGSAEVKKKENRKTFMDLTTLPPPIPWMKSYINGTMLPRILTVYSTETANMVFYDYDPKLKDSSGNEIKLVPQQRTEMDVYWFRKMCYDEGKCPDPYEIFDAKMEP